MDFTQALAAQLSGKYSELLRSSLDQQRAAVDENRTEDQLRWTFFVVKACRFLGRTNEGIVHANHALGLAQQTGNASLEAEALYGLAVSFKCARRFEECLSMLAKADRMVPQEGAEFLQASILLETAETAIESSQKRQAHSTLVRGSALVNWLGEPRLLAWTLYLRSQLEEISPADLQLTAAYEISRSAAIPELQWQILWQLSERADQYGREKIRDDFLSRAIDVLTKLSEPLHPTDGAPFWRQGARRLFVEQTQKRYGKQFFQKIMLEGPQSPGATPGLLRDMGWDPSLIPEYIRTRLASQIRWP